MKYNLGIAHLCICAFFFIFWKPLLFAAINFFATFTYLRPYLIAAKIYLRRNLPAAKI